MVRLSPYAATYVLAIDYLLFPDASAAFGYLSRPHLDDLVEMTVLLEPSGTVSIVTSQYVIKQLLTCLSTE